MALTDFTTPPRLASTHTPESTPALYSMPVPTMGLGAQQRHSLLLHVGAHQGAVGVVVLQEGNHGRGHGDDHPGGDVHVVRLGSGHFHELVPVTAVDLAVDEMALFIQGLVGLGHMNSSSWSAVM